MSKPAPSLPAGVEKAIVRSELAPDGKAFNCKLADCGHEVRLRVTRKRLDERPTTARCPACAGVKGVA